MKKISLILIFVLLKIFGAYSQKHTKDSYNTNINKANRVEIKGGEIHIAKVDSIFIGQVITDKTITSTVYFWGTTTTLGSNGIYTTTFRFAPKQNPGAFSINVIIDFDSSFIPWYQGDPPPPSNTIIFGRSDHVVDVKDDYGYTPNVTPHWTTNYKVLIVRGLVAADNLYVSVRSRTRLFATIRGVAGEVNN